MKIAWFTPLSKQSAIGRFSARVADAIATNVEIDLWTADTGALHSSNAPVIAFRPDDASVRRRLRTYDIVVYNIGNHEPLHGAILDVAAGEPGIVILHDYFLHDLLYAYDRKKGDHTYFDRVTRYYGPQARTFAESFVEHQANDDLYKKYPLFEAVLERQVAAITHEDGHAAEVAKRTGLPVKSIFLSYDAPRCQTGTRNDLKVIPGRLLLISTGDVNPNRQLHAVIEALASPDLRNRYDYRILGSLARTRYRTQLETLIDTYQLHGSVRLLDRTDDATFATYLRHADVCVNLRYPTTESASASAIESMLNAKPLIVSDAGFFSSLPDEIALKVAVREGVPAVASALRRLADSPRERELRGQRGHNWVRDRCTASIYARDFLAFAKTVQGRVRGARLNAHSAMLFDTMRVDEYDQVVDNVIGFSHDLFGDLLR
jgi:glycosyltransferase involved in cell wall biosynthesis